MIKRLSTLFLLASFMIISCGPAEEQELPEPAEDIPMHDRLVSVINPTEGNHITGVISFSREGDNVRIVATVTGLEPESMHGLHVHEYGDCTEGDGSSSGGHYDPFGMPHAGPTDNERHMGDLGNLVSDENGVAELDYVDEVVELDGEFSIIGRGVIVHAEEDDFESQPAGDAGDPLGCGVIGVSQPVEAE